MARTGNEEEQGRKKPTKRRAHGEGSFNGKELDRKAVRIKVSLPDGTRVNVSGKDRAEAVRNKNELLRKIGLGIDPKGEKLTLGEFLDTWMKEVVETRNRRSTVLSYRSYIENHIKPALGAVRLGKLTPQLVQAFLNDRARTTTMRGGRPMSATTVQRIRAILRSALRTAEQWGYVERNSARLADPPRSVRREADFLAVPEVTRLLEFTSDIRAHRLGPLFAFAVATGLRQGELLALTWPQVDLERKTLKVRHTLQKHGKGHWEFAEPKSAAGRRDIPLPEVAIAALRSQQENIREMRILAGADWQESMLVFPSMRGTPLDGSNVTTRFKATLAAAGLRKVRFHDLRHTCGTYLIAQGVSPRTVMAILGHSQISLTLGTYSHATPEMLRDAADAMDKVLVMAPRPARGAAPG